MGVPLTSWSAFLIASWDGSSLSTSARPSAVVKDFSAPAMSPILAAREGGGGAVQQNMIYACAHLMPTSEQLCT